MHWQNKQHIPAPVDQPLLVCTLLLCLLVNNHQCLLILLKGDPLWYSILKLIQYKRKLFPLKHFRSQECKMITQNIQGRFINPLIYICSCEANCSIQIQLYSVWWKPDSQEEKISNNSQNFWLVKNMKISGTHLTSLVSLCGIQTDRHLY